MGCPDHDQIQSSAAPPNLPRPPLARVLALSQGSQEQKVTSRAAEVVEVATVRFLSPPARAAEVAAIVRKYQQTCP